MVMTATRIEVVHRIGLSIWLTILFVLFVLGAYVEKIVGALK